MPQLTVATLNLYGLNYRVDERAELVTQGLLELRPDVIGFQEVNVSSDVGNRICAELNSGDSTAEPRLRVFHVANPAERVVRSCLALITRLPVLVHEAFDYLTEGLEYNRMAQRVRVDVSGQPLDFYNTHLHYLAAPAADETRCEQSRRLLGWMDSHGWDVPKVLVGDFNAWPASEPVRILKERFASAYEVAHGYEPEKTWPTPLVKQAGAPDWTLDYIFLSPGVNVLDARVVFDAPSPVDSDLYASDHFGLAANIEIN